MNQDLSKVENYKSIITFEIGGRKFCSNFDDVIVIVDPEELKQDSLYDLKDPHVVIGVFKVPIIDICKVLGLKEIKKADSNRIIVIEISQKLFGFRVQKIIDIINIDKEGRSLLQIVPYDKLPYTFGIVTYQGEAMYCLDLLGILMNELPNNNF